MNNIGVIENNIPPEIYRHLRKVCGLSAKTDTAGEIGLKNSIYSVMIRMEDEIVGMGRIIGDGGCFCQIVDICVVPEKQGKGLGKVIMENISKYIRDHLPESCYISLIADGDASYLYEKFGFKDTMPASKGMYLKR